MYCKRRLGWKILYCNTLVCIAGWEELYYKEEGCLYCNTNELYCDMRTRQGRIVLRYSAQLSPRHGRGVHGRPAPGVGQPGTSSKGRGGRGTERVQGTADWAAWAWPGRAAGQQVVHSVHSAYFDPVSTQYCPESLNEHCSLQKIFEKKIYFKFNKIK